jgi:hypothetical protein
LFKALEGREEGGILPAICATGIPWTSLGSRNSFGTVGSERSAWRLAVEFRSYGPNDLATDRPGSVVISRGLTN